MDTVRNGQFGLSNTNKLVRFYTGTTGLKTGYTSSAGHCLSASAERDGLELIAVVLHCASSADRFTSAKALLDHGFANYALVQTEPDEALPPLRVRLGTQTALTPVLQDSAPLLTKKGAQIEKTVELPEELDAPLQSGQQLGTLTITSDGQTLAQVAIIAPEAVPRLSWWQLTMRLLQRLCMAGE